MFGLQQINARADLHHWGFSNLDAHVRNFLLPRMTHASRQDTNINVLGDKYLVAGSWGADVSVQRADDLDEVCARYVSHRVSVGLDTSFLDIGGGIGAQSLRVAALGAKATLVEIRDQGQADLASRFLHQHVQPSNRHPVGSVTFVSGDIRRIVSERHDKVVQKHHIFYSQRMWSSIPNIDAENLLGRMVSKDMSADDAVYFFSAIGLHSEIGRSYPHRKRPLRRRWSPYCPEMARKHGVHGSECLYSENNLRRQFRKMGLTVISSWRSDFGNVKIIAVRPATSENQRVVLRNLVKAVRAEKA